MESMDITEFEKIARHLTHPLVLIGFALTLLFKLFDKVLQSGLLSQVTSGESSTIIKLMLQYGFWLGLILIPLGFFHSIWNSWIVKKKP